MGASSSSVAHHNRCVRKTNRFEDVEACKIKEEMWLGLLQGGLHRQRVYHMTLRQIDMALQPPPAKAE